MYSDMETQFSKAFDGKRLEVVYFAPGRVNLIGEHTDYNGGHVFPCALTLGTYVAMAKNDLGVLRFFSTNFKEEGIITSPLDDLDYRKEDDWANYPKGVIQALAKEGLDLSAGVDLCFHGNIPNGAGLSSSASIEVVTAVLFNDLSDLGLDRITLVKLCQQVENQYIGVNCGIMDQFAIGMARKDHALLLDTATLEYRYAPLHLSGYRIVITNTHQRRGLADSAYNERRDQCQRALHALQKALPIESLGDLDETTFESHQHLIKDPVLVKRARHAVTENQRTLKAVEALEADDLAYFGALMKASHQSLKEDYEVSSLPLDRLVELALEVKGVLGSRMTGAGFGGCTVSIVKEEAIEAFKAHVAPAYEASTGLAASFYVVDAGDGAQKIER